MVIFIKQIISKLIIKGMFGKFVECNYSNNYYGDQVCRFVNLDLIDNC